MSLFVMDTDIVTLIQHRHAVVCQHVAAHPPVELAVSVITFQEQLTGRLASVRRARTTRHLADAYQDLVWTIRFFSPWQILSFPEPAILRFEQLKAQRLNVAAMDLRIAAITLENSAVLVTRNKRDFQRIPGLVLEDWTV
jgi:tRNA(fMet)-specific endonuclease VapC